MSQTGKEFRSAVAPIDGDVVQEPSVWGWKSIATVFGALVRRFDVHLPIVV